MSGSINNNQVNTKTTVANLAKSTAELSSYEQALRMLGGKYQTHAQEVAGYVGATIHSWETYLSELVKSRGDFNQAREKSQEVLRLVVEEIREKHKDNSVLGSEKDLIKKTDLQLISFSAGLIPEVVSTPLVMAINFSTIEIFRRVHNNYYHNKPEQQLNFEQYIEYEDKNASLRVIRNTVVLGILSSLGGGMKLTASMSLLGVMGERLMAVGKEQEVGGEKRVYGFNHLIQEVFSGQIPDELLNSMVSSRSFCLFASVTLGRRVAGAYDSFLDSPNDLLQSGTRYDEISDPKSADYSSYARLLGYGCLVGAAVVDMFDLGTGSARNPYSPSQIRELLALAKKEQEVSKSNELAFDSPSLPSLPSSINFPPAVLSLHSKEERLREIYNDPKIVKYVPQFELQAELRNKTKTINNPLVDALYVKNNDGTYKILILKDHKETPKAWELFNHEIRHHWGELSKRQSTEGINESPEEFKSRLANTLRNVEIRAQYQEGMARLEADPEFNLLTKTEKQKKSIEIYNQIKERVENSYSDNLLFDLNQHGLAAKITHGEIDSNLILRKKIFQLLDEMSGASCSQKLERIRAIKELCKLGQIADIEEKIILKVFLNVMKDLDTVEKEYLGEYVQLIDVIVETGWLSKIGNKFAEEKVVAALNDINDNSSSRHYSSMQMLGVSIRAGWINNFSSEFQLHILDNILKGLISDDLEIASGCLRALFDFKKNNFRPKISISQIEKYSTHILANLSVIDNDFGYPLRTKDFFSQCLHAFSALGFLDQIQSTIIETEVQKLLDKLSDSKSQTRWGAINALKVIAREGLLEKVNMGIFEKVISTILIKRADTKGGEDGTGEILISIVTSKSFAEIEVRLLEQTLNEFFKNIDSPSEDVGRYQKFEAVLALVENGLVNSSDHLLINRIIKGLFVLTKDRDNIDLFCKIIKKLDEKGCLNQVVDREMEEGVKAFLSELEHNDSFYNEHLYLEGVKVILELGLLKNAKATLLKRIFSVILKNLNTWDERDREMSAGTLEIFKEKGLLKKISPSFVEEEIEKVIQELTSKNANAVKICVFAISVLEKQGLLSSDQINQIEILLCSSLSPSWIIGFSSEQAQAISAIIDTGLYLRFSFSSQETLLKYIMVMLGSIDIDVFSIGKSSLKIIRDSGIPEEKILEFLDRFYLPYGYSQDNLKAARFFSLLKELNLLEKTKHRFNLNIFKNILSGVVPHFRDGGNQDLEALNILIDDGFVTDEMKAILNDNFEMFKEHYLNSSGERKIQIFRVLVFCKEKDLSTNIVQSLIDEFTRLSSFDLSSLWSRSIKDQLKVLQNNSTYKLIEKCEIQAEIDNIENYEDILLRKKIAQAYLLNESSLSEYLYSELERIVDYWFVDKSVTRLEIEKLKNNLEKLTFFSEYFRYAVANYPHVVTSIQFFDGGNCISNFHSHMKNCFKIPFQLKLKKPRGFPKSKVLDINKIGEIDSELLKILKRSQDNYGRTIVSSQNDKEFIAFKFLKHHEGIETLQRELEFMEYFESNSSSWGLKSKYPKALSIVKIPREAINKFFEHGKMKASNWGINLKCSGKYCFALVYKAGKGYFEYLNDPTLSKDEFEKSFVISVHDRTILASKGIIDTEIIELFHNQEHGAGRIYDWMVDLKHHQQTRRGAGRLNNIPRSTLYPNIRVSGLADFASNYFISDLVKDPRFRDVADNRIGRLRNMVDKNDDEAIKYIYAAYVGDMILSLALMPATYLKRRGELSYRHERDTNDSWLASQLKLLFRQYPGIDYKLMAEQMAFFMMAEYTREDIPGNFYSTPDVKLVRAGRSGSYSEKFGWDIKKEEYIIPTSDASVVIERSYDLGPVNGPNPLQELIRGLYYYTTDFIVSLGRNKQNLI